MLNEELAQRRKDLSLSPTDQSAVHGKVRVNREVYVNLDNYKEDGVGEIPLEEV